MLSLLLYEILPFPERNDNILVKYAEDLKIGVSGTIGQYYEGKCHQTHPEHIVDTETRKTDWCSNINSTKTDYPWYTLALKGKTMRIAGYSIRAGCCYYGCCCVDDNHKIYGCCCDLYSWSFQVSNDNRTWKTLHKVEKDRKFYDCQNRSFDINSNEYYEYVRIIQDEPWPGCQYCMCINKIEIYGTVEDNGLFNDGEDNDDAISIIGKVKSNVE